MRDGVDPIMAAVVAHVRHHYTNYEKLLRKGVGDLDPFLIGEDRREALEELRDNVRRMVGNEIARKIGEWQRGQKETEE